MSQPASVAEQDQQTIGGPPPTGPNSIGHGDAASWQGLTELEAARLLDTDGHNELPSAGPRHTLELVREVLSEPMLLILVATGIVYLVLGDPQEAIAVLIGIFVIIVIEIYQERKTERTLHALRNLASPRALVIRDGTQRRIPGREVVSGDLVVVSEGDRIPADGTLLSARNLSVDESQLTGESTPVRKRTSSETELMVAPGGDDSPFVFSGTMVVQGRGIARVHATGTHTEIGQIGRSLAEINPERSKLQRETDRLVRILALIGLSLCVLVTILYGISRGDWLKGILAGLSLAISMVPEEFPVVLTIFLALGAWRISQAKVLTRRIPAIEMLGAATVLCVDKTGTLTMNRMAVRKIQSEGRDYDVEDGGPAELPEQFHEVLEYSILASKRDPFDPMEKAFNDLGERFLRQTEHLHTDWTLAREYPLAADLLAMSRVWQRPGHRDYIVAAKGAPEAITDLCRLGDSKGREILASSDELASQGLRVLGVARGTLSDAPLPNSQRNIRFEFVGLVALEDPVRPGVPKAIQEARQAGIAVAMITGDYPVTARAIAHQVGLEQPDLVVTGKELDQMSEEELREVAARVKVFARVRPEQKLRLMQAFKKNGEIVAMTGDGVNDALALKAAHIGIAMGARGTDVARESAALVLLDDHFESIVHAVRLGRRIFDNLEKAITFILAVHVPIAGVAIIPLLVGWPFILMPLHIVLLELIIDPASSIAFESEAEESNVMLRPPRNPQRRLFTRQNIFAGLLEGFSIMLTVLLVLWWTVANGYGEQDIRAITFTSLVIGNIALVFANLSRSGSMWRTLRFPNPALPWIVSAAFGLLTATVYVPFLRKLFGFASLHAWDLAISAAAGMFGVLLLEVIRLAFYRKPRFHFQIFN